MNDAERVLMLQVLSEDPTGAPAVLERVRELLAGPAMYAALRERRLVPLTTVTRP